MTSFEDRRKTAELLSQAMSELRRALVALADTRTLVESAGDARACESTALLAQAHVEAAERLTRASRSQWMIALVADAPVRNWLRTTSAGVVAFTDDAVDAQRKSSTVPGVLHRPEPVFLDDTRSRRASKKGARMIVRVDGVEVLAMLARVNATTGIAVATLLEPVGARRVGDAVAIGEVERRPAVEGDPRGTCAECGRAQLLLRQSGMIPLHQHPSLDGWCPNNGSPAAE